MLNNRIHHFLRVTAMVTLMVYLPTNIDLSYAAPALPPTEVSLPASLQLEKNLALALPAELGRIQSLRPGSKGTILHIQTAHGHFEAQEKTEKLLAWLTEKYGSFPVLLEGAVDRLDPTRLDFFPGKPELNLQNARWLAKKALVTGPELFLMQNRSAAAYGIETESAYRDNHGQFVRVLKAKKDAEYFSELFNREMEKAAAVFSPELRGFLKRLEQHELGTVPFEVWLPEIQRAALKYLSLDFNDTAWQVRWPMLVRFFKMEKLAKEFDAAQYDSQKDEFLKRVSKLIPSPSLLARIEMLLNSAGQSVQLPEPETEDTFVEMLRYLSRGFNFKDFPQVSKFIGMLVLQSQLDPGVLGGEVNRLENLIAEKLTRSEIEKKLLSVFSDYRLLEKLMALQLTPQDFDRVDARLRPSEIAKRLALQTQNLDGLDLVFNDAVAFYQGARERDKIMVERAENVLKKNPAKLVVVETGGFHTDALRKHFEKAGYSYGVVTPSISSLDEAGYQNYLKAMLAGASAARNHSVAKVGDQLITVARAMDVLGEKTTRPNAFRFTVLQLRSGRTMDAWRQARQRSASSPARVKTRPALISRSESRAVKKTDAELEVLRAQIQAPLEKLNTEIAKIFGEDMIRSNQKLRFFYKGTPFFIGLFAAGGFAFAWLESLGVQISLWVIGSYLLAGAAALLAGILLWVPRLIDSEAVAYNPERQFYYRLSFLVSDLLLSQKLSQRKLNQFNHLVESVKDDEWQANPKHPQAWQAAEEVNEMISMARSESRGAGVFPWKAVLATASATLSASAFFAHALSEVYYQTTIQPAQKMLEDEIERPEILDMLVPISWQFLTVTLFVLLPTKWQKRVLFHGPLIGLGWWIADTKDWRAAAMALVALGLGLAAKTAFSEIKKNVDSDKPSHRSEARESREVLSGSRMDEARSSDIRVGENIYFSFEQAVAVAASDGRLRNPTEISLALQDAQVALSFQAFSSQAAVSVTPVYDAESANLRALILAVADQNKFYFYRWLPTKRDTVELLQKYDVAEDDFPNLQAHSPTPASPFFSFKSGAGQQSVYERVQVAELIGRSEQRKSLFRDVARMLAMSIIGFAAHLTDAIASEFGVPSLPTVVYTQAGDRKIYVRERNTDGTLGAAYHAFLHGVNWGPHAPGIDPFTNPSGYSQQVFNNYQRDIPMMASMGVNVVRPYYDFGIGINAKSVLDTLYKYGIKVIMPTDAPHFGEVANSANIPVVVNEYKNHPAILMWNIGNEWDLNGYYNRFPNMQSAASFTESAALTIKGLDALHPVTTSIADPHIPFNNSVWHHYLNPEIAPWAVGRGDAFTSVIVNDWVPSVDVWGLQVYRGISFQDVFDQWKSISSKPMINSEFGQDSYDHTSGSENQGAQALYSLQLWDEIVYNAIDRIGGTTSGGLAFEWNDEWWKSGFPGVQTPSYHPNGGQFDNYNDEAYFGLVKIDGTPKLSFYGFQNRFGLDGLNYTSTVSQPSMRIVSDGTVTFEVNGRKVLQRGGGDAGARGFNVLILDETNGFRIKEYRHFDTWLNRYSASYMQAVANYLNAIPAGSIVMIAVSDNSGFEVPAYYQPVATALQNLGSTLVTTPEAVYHWAMVAKKGTGVLAETNTVNPVTAAVPLIGVDSNANRVTPLIVPTVPVIEGLRNQDGNFEITFKTQPNLVYQVEYSDNLAPGSWQIAQRGLVADSTSMQWTDDGSFTSGIVPVQNGVLPNKRFYRVKVIDQVRRSEARDGSENAKLRVSEISDSLSRMGWTRFSDFRIKGFAGGPFTVRLVSRKIKSVDEKVLAEQLQARLNVLRASGKVSVTAQGNELVVTLNRSEARRNQDERDEMSYQQAFRQLEAHKNRRYERNRYGLQAGRRSHKSSNPDEQVQWDRMKQNRSEARSLELIPPTIFWAAVSAFAFAAAASPVVIGITGAWAFLNLALILRPYVLPAQDLEAQKAFFEKYGYTNFGYEPEGALSHLEGGAEDYKGFFYEMTPLWVGAATAILFFPFVGFASLVLGTAVALGTFLIELMFENIVSSLLRVFIYQTIENVSDIVRFYAHEPNVRLAGNAVIRHFAERHILQGAEILAVLGNPTPEYPGQVVELIKKMNPQAVLIVGNGGLDKDGKQIKKPEYKNIREKVLEILAQENLADHWKDKIFISENDKSMNTGQNVGVVAEILARERAAFEARGIPLKKIVLTQMPAGMLLSRRIFEHQWADNAKTAKIEDVQPQFISYAAAQPEIQEGVPMTREAEDLLRFIVLGPQGDGKGQVWRLNEWHQGEKPLIRFHAEDHLPDQTLEVVRQFLARSESRLNTPFPENLTPFTLLQSMTDRALVAAQKAKKASKITAIMTASEKVLAAMKKEFDGFGPEDRQAWDRYFDSYGYEAIFYNLVESIYAYAVAFHSQAGEDESAPLPDDTVLAVRKLLRRELEAFLKNPGQSNLNLLRRLQMSMTRPVSMEQLLTSALLDSGLLGAIAEMGFAGLGDGRAISIELVPLDGDGDDFFWGGSRRSEARLLSAEEVDAVKAALSKKIQIGETVLNKGLAELLADDEKSLQIHDGEALHPEAKNAHPTNAYVLLNFDWNKVWPVVEKLTDGQTSWKAAEAVLNPYLQAALEKFGVGDAHWLLEHRQDDRYTKSVFILFKARSEIRGQLAEDLGEASVRAELDRDGEVVSEFDADEEDAHLHRSESRNSISEKADFWMKTGIGALGLGGAIATVNFLINAGYIVSTGDIHLPTAQWLGFGSIGIMIASSLPFLRALILNEAEVKMESTAEKETEIALPAKRAAYHSIYFSDSARYQDVLEYSVDLTQADARKVLAQISESITDASFKSVFDRAIQKSITDPDNRHPLFKLYVHDGRVIGLMGSIGFRGQLTGYMFGNSPRQAKMLMRAMNANEADYHRFGPHREYFGSIVTNNRFFILDNESGIKLKLVTGSQRSESRSAAPETEEDAGILEMINEALNELGASVYGVEQRDVLEAAERHFDSDLEEDFDDVEALVRAIQYNTEYDEDDIREAIAKASRSESRASEAVAMQPRAQGIRQYTSDEAEKYLKQIVEGGEERTSLEAVTSANAFLKDGRPMVSGGRRGAQKLNRVRDFLNSVQQRYPQVQFRSEAREMNPVETFKDQLVLVHENNRRTFIKKIIGVSIAVLAGAAWFGFVGAWGKEFLGWTAENTGWMIAVYKYRMINGLGVAAMTLMGGMMGTVIGLMGISVLGKPQDTKYFDEIEKTLDEPVSQNRARILKARQVEIETGAYRSIVPSPLHEAALDAIDYALSRSEARGPVYDSSAEVVALRELISNPDPEANHAHELVMIQAMRVLDAAQSRIRASENSRLSRAFQPRRWKELQIPDEKQEIWKETDEVNAYFAVIRRALSQKRFEYARGMLFLLLDELRPHGGGDTQYWNQVLTDLPGGSMPINQWYQFHENELSALKEAFAFLARSESRILSEEEWNQILLLPVFDDWTVGSLVELKKSGTVSNLPGEDESYVFGSFNVLGFLDVFFKNVQRLIESQKLTVAENESLLTAFAQGLQKQIEDIPLRASFLERPLKNFQLGVVPSTFVLDPKKILLDLKTLPGYPADESDEAKQAFFNIEKNQTLLNQKLMERWGQKPEVVFIDVKSDSVYGGEKKSFVALRGNPLNTAAEEELWEWSRRPLEVYGQKLKLGLWDLPDFDPQSEALRQHPFSFKQGQIRFAVNVAQVKEKWRQFGGENFAENFEIVLEAALQKALPTMTNFSVAVEWNAGEPTAWVSVKRSEARNFKADFWSYDDETLAVKAPQEELRNLNLVFKGRIPEDYAANGVVSFQFDGNQPYQVQFVKAPQDSGKRDIYVGDLTLGFQATYVTEGIFQFKDISLSEPLTVEGSAIKPQTLESFFGEQPIGALALNRIVITRQSPVNAKQTVEITVQVPQSLTVSPAVFLDGWFEQKNAGLSFEASVKRGLIKKVTFIGAAAQAVSKAEGIVQPSPQYLNVFTQSYAAQISKGLDGEKDGFASVVSYVPEPTGKEQGLFYAVDFGGTNFRVMAVRLDGKGKHEIVGTPLKVKLPTDLMKGPSAELFAFFAEKFKEHFLDIQKQGLIRKGEEAIRIGFTYSYPAKLNGRVDSATAIQLSKNLQSPDLVGKDVALLFQEALNSKFEKQSQKPKVVAVANDTVGTAVVGKLQNSRSIAGLILGTGRNLARKIKSAVIRGLKGFDAEWLYLNDETGIHTKVPDQDGVISAVDKTLFEIYKKLGSDTYQKMTSGMYLPELVRLHLLDAAEKGLIFKSGVPEILNSAWNEEDLVPKGLLEVFSKMTLTAETENYAATKRALEILGVKQPVREELNMVYSKVMGLYRRSAYLSAPEIMGTALFYSPELNEEVVISIDGSLFEKVPAYRGWIETALADIAEVHFGSRDKAKNIKLELVKDGSGIGAAMIAAIVTARSEQRAGSVTEVAMPAPMDYRQTLADARRMLVQWLGGIVPQRWLSAIGFTDAAAQVRVFTGASAFAEEVPVAAVSVLDRAKPGAQWTFSQGQAMAAVPAQTVIHSILMDSILNSGDGRAAFELLNQFAQDAGTNVAPIAVFTSGGDLKADLRKLMTGKKSGLTPTERVKVEALLKLLQVQTVEAGSVEKAMNAYVAKHQQNFKIAVLLPNAGLLDQIRGALTLALGKALSGRDTIALAKLARVLQQASLLEGDAQDAFLQKELPGITGKNGKWTHSAIQALLEQWIANHELIAISA